MNRRFEIEETLMLVSRFYKELTGSRESYPAVIRYSRDTGKSQPLSSPMWQMVLRRIPSNIYEFGKCRLRHRPLNLTRFLRLDLPIRTTLLFNFWNGTVVSLRESSVEKFYLTESDFYRRHYLRLERLLRLSVGSFEGVTVLKQLRYSSYCCDQVAAQTIAQEAAEQLRVISEAVGDGQVSDDDYSLSSVVLRLCSRYGGGTQLSGLGPYDEIVTELNDLTAEFSTALCHGDLTPENIVIDESGRLSLIDFDKVFLAPPAYDRVYFATSLIERAERLWSRPLDEIIRRVLVRVREHKLAGDGSESLSRTKEIVLCVFIIAFLKKIERDLNYGQIGRAISEIAPYLHNLHDIVAVASTTDLAESTR
jgi:hypothetical protein